MNVIVPSVITVSRNTRTVGSIFDFSQGLDLPTSASFSSATGYTPTTATASKGSTFSFSGILNTLTDTAAKLAGPVLQYKAQDAQLRAQTSLLRAQTDAQIAALQTPASSPVFLPVTTPTPAMPMSSGAKIGLGIGAALLLAGGVYLIARK